jgi:hypothetical protein
VGGPLFFAKTGVGPPLILTQFDLWLGAVYTCDFKYESAYNSVYDLATSLFLISFADMCRHTIVMHGR